MRYFFYVFVALFLAACSSPKNIAKSKIAEDGLNVSSLKFLDEYVIPFNTHFQNTWVGGLSGIDYDKRNDRYFIISDERSITSASRFYTAAVDIRNYKIDSVRFLSTYALRDSKNDTFPSLKTFPEHAADPESIRYNAYKNTIVWSSEGDKAIRNGKMVYQDPWVFEADIKGNFKDSFNIPANIRIYKDDKGARENDVLEGLSFSADYKYLWASMEGATYEDGPLATASYANAPVRFTKFDAATKQPLLQYGYLLDAVATSPQPAEAFSINGVSENLYIGANKFFVLERSFSTGTAACTIKIYLADFSKATDVLHIKSLYQNLNYTPASKKLLFNFNSLNRFIDNIEGITLGPLLPNGHQSLLLVVDNNFNPLEQSQVFLFEIIP